MHIDHGSRSKVVGLGWKSPSSDFQDPRESWGDAQDTEKVESDNPQILQDSIGLQREVKSLLGAIGKGKEGGSTKGQSSKRPDKKRSKHEDSKEIEQVKMKQPVKCWECGGHHLCRYCPTREHKEGSSHKVPRLRDKPRDENQQEKLVEVEGLGSERSK